MKEIPLTRGLVALVDDEDHARLSVHRWHADISGKTAYAKRQVPGGKRQRGIKMHREIMNPPKGFVVDHINGDGLDNRRSNLRVCTHAQNITNSRNRKWPRRFKGVYPSRLRWSASITVNRKMKYLGLFKTEVEAAEAYNRAAIEAFGQFAILNHIPERK